MSWQPTYQRGKWQPPLQRKRRRRFLVEGTVLATGIGNTYRFDSADGNEIWYVPTGSVVSTDPKGFVYLAGDGMIKKLRPDGVELWSSDIHEGGVSGVAVDFAGNVYSTGSTDNFVVRKFDPNGNPLWVFDAFSARPWRIAVDVEGNSYFGDAAGNVRKLDPNGELVWTYTGHTDQVYGIDVGPDNTVYTGARDNTVRRLDASDGTLIWTNTSHSANINNVAVDQGGFVHTAGTDSTVRKIDPDGNLVWTFSGHSNWIYGVGVDPEGFVYTGSVDNTVRKLDPDGNQLWATNVGHTVASMIAPPGRYGAFPDEWRSRVPSVLTTAQFVVDPMTITATDQEPITTYEDKGIVWSQASTDAPLYIADDGGLPAFSLEGNKYWTGPLDLVRNKSGYTVVTVQKIVETPSGTTPLVYASTASGGQFTRMGLYAEGTTEWEAGGRRLDSNGYQAISGGTQDPPQWQVVSARFDYTGQLLNLWQGTTEVASSTSFSSGGGNTSDTDSVAVSIGAIFGGTGGDRYHGGRIRYLLGFDFYVDDSDFIDLLVYVSNTYGE